MASPSKKIVHMDTASDLKLRDMQYKDKMSLLNKNFLQVSRKLVQTCVGIVTFKSVNFEMNDDDFF